MMESLLSANQLVRMCNVNLRPLYIAALLLLPACESQYHARVHRLPELPPAAADHPQAAGTAHKPQLRPLTHSGFTYMPTYPRTLSCWKDNVLLRSNGPRRIVIDLTTQRGMLFIDGRVAMDFPVCTGKADKPTPRGDFSITQKNVKHLSNLYHVPMPYFMRLTNDGIGLHAGKVRRKPSSHGCIRLQEEDCKLLFSKVAYGTPVTIR